MLDDVVVFVVFVHSPGHLAVFASAFQRGSKALNDLVRNCRRFVVVCFPSSPPNKGRSGRTSLGEAGNGEIVGFSPMLLLLLLLGTTFSCG